MDPKEDYSTDLPQPQTGRQSLTGGKADPAVDLIRQKINQLYTKEPNAKQELAEAEAQSRKHSKHQQFMHELSNSGKSLAEIQTAWHSYYVELPDHEKHEVWQEFYRNYDKANGPVVHTGAAHTALDNAHNPHRPIVHASDPRSVADIKQQLVGRTQHRRKLEAKDHAKSLLFGLGIGTIALVLLLFSFFNERFLAPFITPSRSVSNTPIIIDPGSVAVGSEPKIIIPKINVEIPVIYTEPSINDAAVERALEGGVLHYPTTPDPGELGNGVIFGHSSNNILNKGKYKFAFVLLKRLEVGDTFMLQKDGKQYVYKVFDKKIVKPEDVSVLNNASKPATFTLITCDPPGTSINRLVVVGEQISPDVSTNIASKVNPQAAAKPQILPSNSETLWHRLTQWLAS